MFTVGQRVFSTRKGWGVITEVHPPDIYTVGVRFKNNRTVFYTKDGKCYQPDLYPELLTEEQLFARGRVPALVAFDVELPKKKVWVWAYATAGLPCNITSAKYASEEEVRAAYPTTEFRWLRKIEETEEEVDA